MGRGWGVGGGGVGGGTQCSMSGSSLFVVFPFRKDDSKRSCCHV